MARSVVLPRECYIPQGAVKVADDRSSAVVYLYEEEGGNKFCVAAFRGRRSKPEWHYGLPDAKRRSAQIEGFFETVRAQEKAVKEARQPRPRGLAVGDVLYASWGYDQTNVDYFEVTSLIGSTMVEVRQIRAEMHPTSDYRGYSIPCPGEFVGEPLRRGARDGYVRIDDVRFANVIHPECPVPGVRVFKPHQWTSYA